MSNIRYEDYIENLEVLADELAGAGDIANADFLSEVIRLLEDVKNLNIAKPVENEGDCLRCPNCFRLVFSHSGRCYDCGQKIIG